MIAAASAKRLRTLVRDPEIAACAARLAVDHSVRFGAARELAKLAKVSAPIRTSARPSRCVMPVADVRDRARLAVTQLAKLTTSLTPGGRTAALEALIEPHAASSVPCSPEFPATARLDDAYRALVTFTEWELHPHHVYTSLVAAGRALVHPADVRRLVDAIARVQRGHCPM